MVAFIEDTSINTDEKQESLRSITLQFVIAVDANGNVMQLVDSAGSVQASYEYDAFGNIIASSGTMADENPFRFSTKYYDDETKLSYYGFRYYDAALGRWLNRDPIGELGGLNLVAFCNNSVLDHYDLLGQVPALLIAIGKDILKDIAGDIVKKTLGAWFDKKMTEANIYWHLQRYCGEKNQWHSIDLHWAKDLDGIGKRVAKEIAMDIPGKVVDAVLWNKLKSARYIKRTRALARKNYGLQGQKITEKIQTKILSDVRGQVQGFAQAKAKDITDFKKDFTIKYFNPSGEHSDCTLCYTLKLNTSFKIFDLPFNLPKEQTKCLEFHEFKRESVARNCGLCPCSKKAK
ncbi:hypothetical protein BVX97_02630 [bacterium E08(2017)]|nr:hypothetical protein BVX97_02630 [bacterium E08(2017)]